MKKAFVISAAAFIAIGAAVFSSTKANAEDNGSGAGLLLSHTSLPRRKPITITLITIALIIDVTAAITENVTLF
jgi:hypothetical protein